MAEWLLPFSGRLTTNEYAQNLLWRHDRTYIMDNHRAAMWCWCQHYRGERDVQILHLDAHTDTLSSRISEWCEHVPNLHEQTAKEWSSYTYKCMGAEVPLFRWDNYLSIFLEVYESRVTRLALPQEAIGDLPQHPRSDRFPSVDAVAVAEDMCARGPSIVNVDLDYFFRAGPDGCVPQHRDQVEPIFRAAREGLRSGSVVALTIALTPEPAFTGGWEASELLCEGACDALGLDFSLPDAT